MRVRVKVRPTGLLNGKEWPEVGEMIDLPEGVAEGMIEAGALHAVKAAPAKKPAKKPAEKVEVRPASKADTETRISA